MLLADVIRAHLHTPFEALPDESRSFIRRAFLARPFGPGEWFELTPKLRASYAKEYDAAHTDAKIQEDERLWAHEVEIDRIENELKRYESMSDMGVVSEALLREAKLIELRGKLGKLKAQRVLPTFIEDNSNFHTAAVLPPSLVNRVSKDEQRILVIEAVLADHGLNPLALKIGEKAVVLAICASNPKLFGCSPHAFNRAWQKAVNLKRVRMKEHNRYSGKQGSKHKNS